MMVNNTIPENMNNRDSALRYFHTVCIAFTMPAPVISVARLADEKPAICQFFQFAKACSAHGVAPTTRAAVAMRLKDRAIESRTALPSRVINFNGRASQQAATQA